MSIGDRHGPASSASMAPVTSTAALLTRMAESLDDPGGPDQVCEDLARRPAVQVEGVGKPRLDGVVRVDDDPAVSIGAGWIRHGRTTWNVAFSAVPASADPHLADHVDDAYIRKYGSLASGATGDRMRQATIRIDPLTP